MDAIILNTRSDGEFYVKGYYTDDEGYHWADKYFVLGNPRSLKAWHYKGCWIPECQIIPLR